MEGLCLNLKKFLAAVLHAPGINAQFAAVTNCPEQGDSMVEKSQAQKTLREATAVFNAEDELRDVINELESAGFDHADEEHGEDGGVLLDGLGEG